MSNRDSTSRDTGSEEDAARARVLQLNRESRLAIFV
jgi:hypothetical protein